MLFLPRPPVWVKPVVVPALVRVAVFERDRASLVKSELARVIDAVVVAIWVF